jgi:hypothetical protein
MCPNSRGAGQPRPANWSVSSRSPRRDLLDDPRVAVRIDEGSERSVACTLEVGTWKPRFLRYRRTVPYIACFDAAVHKIEMGRFDIGDDERAFGRARRRRGEPLAESN